MGGPSLAHHARDALAQETLRVGGRPWGYDPIGPWNPFGRPPIIDVEGATHGALK